MDQNKNSIWQHQVVYGNLPESRASLNAGAFTSGALPAPSLSQWHNGGASVPPPPMVAPYNFHMPMVYGGGHCFEPFQPPPQEYVVPARFLTFLQRDKSFFTPWATDEAGENGSLLGSEAPSLPDQPYNKSMFGSSLPTIAEENTGDDLRQRKPDIAKAKNVLRWEPKASTSRHVMEEHVPNRM